MGHLDTIEKAAQKLIAALPEGKTDENRQGENVGDTCRDSNEH